MSPESLPIFGRRRRCVDEDQMGYVLGMARRVLHREDSAPRMAEHRDGVESEVTPHGVEVADLRSKADFLRLYVSGRPPASPLVVVDEAERVGESIHLREQ
jgi:hypothetical protein